MSDTPTPRSYPQTLGDMFDAFLSNQGIRSLRVGSPIVSILEAAAQSDMRNSQDIFNLLTSADLDNATGLALERIGRSERVPKLEVSPTTGLVTISDTSFAKISSKLFQGAPAPIVGSLTISVVDATLFPAAGSIYIGRGTSNYEGPLAYGSKTNVGSHWELNLSSGTTRFHNTTETAILAQGGNRTVGPSTTVRTPQANTQNAIEFRTLFSVTLPDGETSIANVDIIATKPGLIGNVIAGAIREFANSPFTGSFVTNPSPFVNGRETESDDEYRERIRAVRASRQLGTSLAIITAVTGITAFDENKRINSASLVKRFGFPATLYIDDGTGYEERTAPVAIESLMDDAVGGETHFQTTQRPIARAFVTTKNTAPFVLRPTDQLSVKVGGVTYTHVFREDQFHSISNASVFEVVASINSNPNIAFVARAAESGTKVSIFANADVNEDVEVVTAVDGTDGNDGLGFPGGLNYTMRLYKNDRLLVKDGVIASVVGLPFAQWDAVTISQTLEMAIDHTPAISFEFTDQDFIDAQTGYATLGRNSLAAWVAVINAKVPGITASENSGRLVLTSNAGPVEKAGVAVVGGTLVSAHFFGFVSAEGAPRDYTLDRNEAQISLTTLLEAGDTLTAGSFATRAFLESDEVGSVTLANDARLWFAADSNAEIIEHGVTPSTDINIYMESVHDFGMRMKFQASSPAFANVQAQDWVVLWDDALPESVRGVHRVVQASDTEVVIERHSSSLTRRSGHRSVRLVPSGNDIGKILTCGGGTRARATISHTLPALGILNTVEVYDPNTKTVSVVAPMNSTRTYHTATTLANGKVVVIGGLADGGTYPTSIETYDPVLDTWTVSGVSLTTARKNHTATLLTDGRILIAGGDQGTNGTVTATYQIYNPSGDTISTQASMVSARSIHCAVKLPDNTVLVAGGIDTSGADRVEAERFTPGIDTFASTGSMGIARSGFGMSDVELVPTLVIAAGNHRGGFGNDSWETYDIGGGTWNTPNTMFVAFENKPLTKIANGNVVGLDGFVSDSVTSYAGFIYDGTTFTEYASGPASSVDGVCRWDSQYVEVRDDVAGVENFVASIDGTWQHSTPWTFQPTAILEVYDTALDSWDAPDPAIGGPYNLLDTGIAFARTDGFVQESVVPAGTNYTANSLSDALNDDLEGMTSTVYKTTRLRINTNTYADGGDIALITQNTDAEGMQVEPASHVENLATHVGSVQSGSSELGTPSFEDVHVIGQTKGTPTKLVVTSTSIDVDYALVGLRNWWRGADGTSAHLGSGAYINRRANSNFQFRTRLTEYAAYTYVSDIAPREEPVQTWGPLDRAYLAAPYATGSNGTLEVVVDNDISRHFSVNMWRTLTTVGTTYAATNTFRDGDADGVTLAETFGLEYDFNDFAVYMASRAKAFASDANREMVFRYFRLGPDGDGVRVRFGNATAANQALSVVTDIDDDGLTNVTVKLKSGAARAITTHLSTHFGRGITTVSSGGIATLVYVLNLAIVSASRTTDVTTATLTLPAGITDHGLTVGTNIWVNSTNINFSSGLKQITGVTATTVDYDEVDSDVGATANVGTVSYDSQGESTFLGSATVATDFLYFRSLLVNYVFQVSALGSNDGHVFVKSGNQPSSGFGTSTTLSWFPQISGSPLTVFANSPQTATEVVAAINALQDAEDSTCPIKVVEIGTGASNITQNTPDFLDDRTAWYTLADGINWVKETTVPLTIVDDYELEFKNAVEGTLSTNSDWENEVVRIVPITNPNMVEWFNTPAVSGLFTLADIEESDGGSRLQITTLTAGSAGGIEVQGGLANDVTAPVVGTPLQLGDDFSGNLVARLDADGMTTGMWARIQNENPLPKLSILPTGTVLTGWDAAGLLTFGSSVVDEVSAPTQLKVAFEKQGTFVAISDMGASGSASWGSVVAGSWVRISAPTVTPTSPMVATSLANEGIYRVVRVSPSSLGDNAGTLYIENISAIEEFSECTVAVYGPDSVMPGDQLVILSPVWGAANVATWDVVDVGTSDATSGDSFSNTTSFVVDVSSRPVIPQGTLAALTNATSSLIYIREGQPGVFVMRIHGISPNQDDGSFLNIIWDKHVDASAISASAGSIISILDKLAFSTTFAAGSDGYRYDTGLLREANKVVYGDPTDTSTYPGVAAADAHINIQGPLVKRIQVAVSVRVRSGLNTQDIANRVRSAIATVVNKTPIGQSIAFSDIIDGARDVVGVVSVTIVSPLYSVGHDQIKVQPYEKPFVLDLAQDVQVSFVGV